MINYYIFTKGKDELLYQRTSKLTLFGSLDTIAENIDDLLSVVKDNYILANKELKTIEDFDAKYATLFDLEQKTV